MNAAVEQKPNPIQRKVIAGGVTGGLGIIAVWLIEVSTGITVPAMVALAIDTVLVGIVQYAIRNKASRAPESPLPEPPLLF